jgi:hypothetical protein
MSDKVVEFAELKDIKAASNLVAPSVGTAAGGAAATAVATPVPAPVASATDPGPSPEYEINDPEFIAQLEQLLALRSFLTRQAISLSGLASTSHLNMLRLAKRGGGRSPTAEEWQLLDQNTEALFGLLSEPMRRRFLSSQIPAWVTQTAMVLGCVAVLAFVSGYIVPAKVDIPELLLMHFLIWVGALGAIGSIAFIGMNALAVQDDATFDLTNERLIVLRVVLGALFAVVLTLPFGFAYFQQFLRDLGGDIKPVTDATELLKRAVMLLLPFILGFSTTLVIMILNRLVEAVQTLFGKGGSGAPPAIVVATPNKPAPTPPARTSPKQPKR